MKILGFKKLPIDKLKLQGDFRARLESPRIVERARSVARVGILSEPMVRMRDKRVIYGHDRIAAAVKAGHTVVLCKIVDCTDAELAELELTENAHRRHEPDVARQALVQVLDLYEAQAEEDPDGHFEISKGKVRSPRAIARERLAAEKGIKPESVRRTEARAKVAAIKNPEKLTGESPARIALVGMDVEEAFLGAVGRIQRQMDMALHAARTLQTALSAIKDAELPFPAGKLQRLYDDAHALAASLRAQKPVALCPYCKGMPDVQDACPACLRSGWISEAQSTGVPKELWREGDGAVVAWKGQYHYVADMLAERRQQEPVVVLDELEKAEDLFA